ncbi:MAG: hypothetical protein PHC94_06765 [Methylobacter sp.]|nr:hypothetical protein [Methylococcales bacterium]MDD5113701.1 hypothetical protein [Methylobacter sp.]
MIGIWQIEQYQRAIKQVCNIERFQVRSKGAIKNHLFAAICGFVQLQKLSFAAVINNCYGVQRNLFKEVIASFIGAFMSKMRHLNPEFQRVNSSNKCRTPHCFAIHRNAP